MLFNILVIDDEFSSRNFSFITDSLDNTRISILSDYSTISAVLKEEAIHMIIINPDIFSLDEFKEMIEENNLKYITNPIFIVGQEKDLKFDFDFIYDYISLEMSQELIIRKVRFCKELFERELNYQTSINKLLYTDSLTQLPNRVKLIKDLQNGSFHIDALAIIDIKNFRGINDFFGIRIGDKVLKHTKELLTIYIELINNRAVLYKFPADVFCLANNGLSTKEFQDLVFYMLSAINNQIIKEHEYEIDIDAVAGITFSKKKNKLITADLALQKAKLENKLYIVFYEKLDNLEEYENNMYWTKKLKKALLDDDVTVYFQPILDNRTKKVEKYEVLVRLYDKEKDEVVLPYRFLEISKKACLYKDITKNVIEKSFKEFESLDYEFSINISYEDINDPTFLIYVEEMLKKYQVSKRLTWEILEDENIQNYDVLINFIKAVKKLDCKVAIDDFGTGYSNFEHLLKMDVDCLKIDASLVKNIVKDKTSYKIVETIIKFAKNLNLKTVAEFVESKEIFDLVNKLGVDFSQGNYISEPIEKPNFKEDFI